MKVILTNEYRGEDWGDGKQLSGESISAQIGEVKASYRVAEGEPEDMIFGRDLKGVGSIVKLMEMAHKAGQANVDLEFETIEERD